MGKKRRKKGSRSRSSARRKKEARGVRRFEVAVVAMFVLAIYFAILGGEYTIFQLKDLERLEAKKAEELSGLQAEIDSLEVVADRLENDPAEIERVARERYGMIRDGEVLYRFQEDPAPADSVNTGPGAPR